MDRPEELPDDVAKELEKLHGHELLAASRYAERLAEQHYLLNKPDQFIFYGDENTYYEPGLGEP